jgi:hypothetical protein
MKRITPEDVVDAYIATGLYPVFKKWRTKDGGGGCGLTAIGNLNGHCVKGGSRIDRYAKLLEMDRGYLYGFAAGFDAIGFNPFNDEQASYFGFSAQHISLGVEDGRAARKAVMAHFAKAKQEAAQQVPALEPVR